MLVNWDDDWNLGNNPDYRGLGWRQLRRVLTTFPFVDWDRARVAVFPHLKPSTETISLRVPTALLSELKALANKRDVPYQSLLKVFLADRVASEVSRFDRRTGKALPPAGRRRRTAGTRKASHAGRS